MGLDLETLLLRIFVGLIVAVYFFYEWKERKIVRDEREILIHMKSLELMHKIFSYSLIPWVILYMIYPKMDAVYPIIVYATCCCAVHPISKQIYRRV
jgi:protein-S-isoprenylcysteine O-methyltransferase Ste14